MKQRYKILFSLIITIIFTRFLLFQVDIKDFSEVFKKISLGWILAAFLFLVLSYSFQARRFQLLLRNQIGFFHLFNIVCIYNFFLNILPFRSGELSYLYLINKSGKIKTGENLSSLIVARFLDFLVISLFFFISSCFILKIKTQFFWQTSLYLALFVFLLLIIFFAVIFYPGRFNRLADTVVKKTALRKFGIFVFLQQKIEETLEAVRGLRSKKIFFFLIFDSLIMWLFSYGATFLLAKGVGLNLNFLQAVFAFSLPLFFAVFFIQGMGGFGTIEGGWALGLTLIGVSKESAVGSSFLIHALALVCFFLLAGFGFVNLKNMLKLFKISARP